MSRRRSLDRSVFSVTRALRFTLLVLAVVVLTNVLLELNRYDYGRYIGLCIIAFCVWLYVARQGAQISVNTLCVAVGVLWALGGLVAVVVNGFRGWDLLVALAAWALPATVLIVVGLRLPSRLL